MAEIEVQTLLDCCDSLGLALNAIRNGITGDNTEQAIAWLSLAQIEFVRKYRTMHERVVTQHSSWDVICHFKITLALAAKEARLSPNGYGSEHNQAWRICCDLLDSLVKTCDPEQASKFRIHRSSLREQSYVATGERSYEADIAYAKTVFGLVCNDFLFREEVLKNHKRQLRAWIKKHSTRAAEIWKLLANVRREMAELVVILERELESPVNATRRVIGTVLKHRLKMERDREFNELHKPISRPSLFFCTSTAESSATAPTTSATPLQNELGAEEPQSTFTFTCTGGMYDVLKCFDHCRAVNSDAAVSFAEAYRKTYGMQEAAHGTLRMHHADCQKAGMLAFREGSRRLKYLTELGIQAIREFEADNQ